MHLSRMKYGWGAITDLASGIGKSISYVDRRLRAGSVDLILGDAMLK